MATMEVEEVDTDSMDAGDYMPEPPEPDEYDRPDAYDRLEETKKLFRKKIRGIIRSELKEILRAKRAK